jgi:hypothetical protein
VKLETNHVTGAFLIFIFLLGAAHLCVPLTEGQQNARIGESYWLRLANNAWKYFQPGTSVDSTTGLHYAGLWFPYFTDWDLGVYIQAIIDANKLGILSDGGLWGADARFSKVLTFLQNRQHSSNGLPYSWYQSSNGNPWVFEEQNAADAGELLVSLNNLKVFRPTLASTINSIVYDRTNYTRLEQAVDALTGSKNIYDYYVASGFAGFWSIRFSSLASSILSNIVSAPTVSTYGAKLPTAKLTCEPLLLSIFNLAPNVKVDSLTDQVYSAHEARYNVTGKFVAFSEGNTGLDGPDYVYEWVVKQDGSTWSVDDGQVKVGISPIIYFKSATGLLAMHDTPFTEKMVSYLESHLPNPTSGYADGIDENGRVDTTTIDKTNSMVIGAALYAINNLQNPTPSPKPTPTPTNSHASATPSPSSTSSVAPTSPPNSPSASPDSSPAPNSSSASSTPDPSTNSSPSSTSSNAPSPSPGSPSLSPGVIPTPSGSILSPTYNPLTTDSPSPSTSNATSYGQLENWFAAGLISVIVIISCLRLVQVVSGYRRNRKR